MEDGCGEEEEEGLWGRLALTNVADAHASCTPYAPTPPPTPPLHTHGTHARAHTMPRPCYAHHIPHPFPNHHTLLPPPPSQALATSTRSTSP